MKITENLAIFQAIDLMLVDALVSANDYLQIASHIEDPSQYWKVGYLYIFCIPNNCLLHYRDICFCWCS